MSWDVMILDTRGKTPPMEELQEDAMDPLGSAEEVRQKISEQLSGVDWSDATWGMYEGDGFSIEFNVGDKEVIDSVMLHVRGGGEAIAAIFQFAGPLGWSVLDISEGGFLAPDNPSQAGWEGFQDYRDRVIKQDGGDSK